MKAKKPAKFDDTQIKNGALESEGKFIAAQIEVMRRYETAAEEKAGHELKKAEENRATIEKRLADVHAKCTRGGFTAFKAKYAPDFGRTKLYQILAIGSGKKTREQVRTEEREKKRAQRAAKKSSGQTDVPNAAAGNGGDPEASAAAMKAAHAASEHDGASADQGGTVAASTPSEAAKAAGSDVDQNEAAAAAPELTPEERSDDALKAVKESCWSHCPKMLAGDLQRFRVFVAQYTNDLEKKMRKAA